MKTTGKVLLAFAVTLAFILPVAAIAPKAPIAQINQKPHASAEWVEQATGFSTASRGINFVCPVNESIVWAEAYDGVSGGTVPCNEYTKTIDGGTTWVPGAVNGADGLFFSCIWAVDENTAWACMYSTGEGTQGIYATTNGGALWTRQSTAVFDYALGAFADCVYFWDANNGWCLGDPTGGYFEIYTTTDGGNNWNRVPSENIPAPLAGEWGIVGYYSVVGDNVWFGTELGRVYHSADRGYTWTAAQTTLGAYIKPVFKDELNGLAIDLNANAIAELSETSDGGATWTAVSFTGTCHDADLCYIPGTPNTYYSTGANTNAGDLGVSYSDDGGHSWTEVGEQADIQMMNMGFVADRVGWAGGFNVDETTGGIWKHLKQEQPPVDPILKVTVTGGTGFSVNVANIGTGNATDVSFTANIAGGLFMKQREYNGTIDLLAPGANKTVSFTVMGIGLGIIKKPVPTIKADATCAEGKTASATVSAKIFLSKVTLQ
jgi:hypothetical protein